MKRIVGIILAGIGIITVISGFLFKTAGQTSVAVIGSADGPTSIFIVGKVRMPSTAEIAAAGIILIAAGLFVLFWKRKS